MVLKTGCTPKLTLHSLYYDDIILILSIVVVMEPLVRQELMQYYYPLTVPW